MSMRKRRILAVGLALLGAPDRPAGAAGARSPTSPRSTGPPLTVARQQSQERAKRFMAQSLQL